MRSIMNKILRILKNNGGSIKYSDLEDKLFDFYDLNEINLAVHLLKDNEEIKTEKGVLYYNKE